MRRLLSLLSLFLSLFFLFGERGREESLLATPNHASFFVSEASPVVFSEKSISEPVVSDDHGPRSCEKEHLFQSFSEKEQLIFQSAFGEMPCEFLGSLQLFSVYDDLQKPRALASASGIRLRKDLLSLPEARQVLIHELGHIVDLGGLLSRQYQEKSLFFDGSLPIFSDDPSVMFYEISWNSNTSWKSEIDLQDFVSQYAGTDPFEDFAESFLMYREYGESFRQMAQNNTALKKKYVFLREQVFSGKEFSGEISGLSEERVWDITRAGS